MCTVTCPVCHTTDEWPCWGPMSGHVAVTNPHYYCASTSLVDEWEQTEEVPGERIIYEEVPG